MALGKEEVCARCRYWVPTVMGENLVAIFGECRRMPPVMGKATTGHDYGCGAFREDVALTQKRHAEQDNFERGGSWMGHGGSD